MYLRRHTNPDKQQQCHFQGSTKVFRALRLQRLAISPADTPEFDVCVPATSCQTAYSLSGGADTFFLFSKLNKKLIPNDFQLFLDPSILPCDAMGGFTQLQDIEGQYKGRCRDKTPPGLLFFFLLQHLFSLPARHSGQPAFSSSCYITILPRRRTHLKETTLCLCVCVVTLAIPIELALISVMPWLVLSPLSHIP